MKLTIDRNTLLDGIKTVQRSTLTRTALYVLENILFDAKEGVLRLSATDLVVRVNCEIEADVEEPGSTTIPAKTLYDLVRAFSDNEVFIDLDSNKEIAHVRCGKSKTKIKCIGADEFPGDILLTDEPSITIGAEVFKKMVKQTSFAASKERHRETLTGVLFSVHDNVIKMKSTDGYRVSVYKEELPFDLDFTAEALIPGAALDELDKLIDDDESTIAIAIIGTSKAYFSYKNINFIAQLVNYENYPDIDQLIPESSPTVVTVSKAKLTNAIHQASVFARDATNIGKLFIDAENNRMIVTGEAQERGEAKIEIPISVGGDGLEIGFNLNYLQDALDAMVTDDVEIGMSTKSSPGTFKGIGDDEFVHVIMPMVI